MYYDIKKVTWKIKYGGVTTTGSYNGNVGGFTRPQSEYEAQKIAETWLLKKFPGAEIIDLKVEIK